MPEYQFSSTTRWSMTHAHLPWPLVCVFLGSIMGASATSDCCLTASIAGDPHCTGAHGDIYDVRGYNRGTYCLLSAPNISVNALFEDTIFHTPYSKLDVNGSFIRSAFWVLRTPRTAREVQVAFHAREPHWATATIGSQTVTVSDAAPFVIEVR